MKLLGPSQPRSWRNALAASLIEVLVAVSIVGIMFTSLYGGITSGFAIVYGARENMRATQIMIEKMEIMRLYSWDQVTSNGFIPTTFTETFYPTGVVGTITNNDPGITYYGTLTLTNAPVADGYTNSMRRVILSLSWTNGGIGRTRSMDTLVSELGIQKYVY